MALGLPSASRIRQQIYCPFGTSGFLFPQLVGGWDMLCHLPHSLFLCFTILGGGQGWLRGESIFIKMSQLPFSVPGGEALRSKAGLVMKGIYILGIISLQFSPESFFYQLYPYWSYVISDVQNVTSPVIFQNSLKDKYFNIGCHYCFI